MTFHISCFADEISDDLGVQLSQMAVHGIKWLELRGADGKNVSVMTPDDIKSIKTRLACAGVRVSSLGSPIGKINIKEDFEPHFQMFLRLLDTAKELDCRYIRVFSFYVDRDEHFEDSFDEICRRLTRMTDAARSAGIVLLHENEKGIYGDTALRCQKLMQRLFCENFAFTFDPANFIQCGQKVMQAYGMLKDYVRYVHIKDAIAADGSVVPAGYGDGEIKTLLESLSNSGYDGFLSLEPHLGTFKGFSDLEKDGSLNFSTDMDGAGRFGIAVDALKKLVDFAED